MLEVGRVVAVKDAPIVAAALHASCAYLATYDRKHLLQQRSTIKEHFGITVAKPNEVLSLIGA